MTKYWRSIEELKDPAEFKKAELRFEVEASRAFYKKDAGSSRRDFLKFMGFSVATAAVVTSCKKPVNKAIPFLIKPEILLRSLESRGEKKTSPIVMRKVQPCSL